MKRALITFLVMLLFGSAAWFFLQSPLFRLDRIEIDGLNRLEQQEVLQMMGVEGGQHLFSFSLGRLEGQLLQDPRLATVEVQRRLPGILTVSLVEVEAVAVVMDGGLFALIDAGGRVIQIDDHWQHDFLPVLSGIDVDGLRLGGRAVHDGEEVLYCATLLGRQRSEISEIFTQEGSVVLITERGGQVLFPVRRADMARAVEVLSQFLREHQPISGMTIDLRVPDRPVVRGPLDGGE